MLYDLGPWLRPDGDSVAKMLKDCWQELPIARQFPQGLDIFSSSQALVEQAKGLAGAEASPEEAKQGLLPVMNRIQLGPQAQVRMVQDQAYAPNIMPLDFEAAPFEEVFPFTSTTQADMADYRSLQASLLQGSNGSAMLDT